MSKIGMGWTPDGEVYQVVSHGRVYQVVDRDVLDAKDARIAELERQIADLKSERLRNPGSYYIVPRETMEAKDARIAELERKLSEASRCDHTAESLRIGQYQHEIAALKEENAKLKARLAGAKAQNAEEKRLACEEGKYDKCGVGGISVDGATKAALLAEQMLASGYDLSYAAACLLVLHRKLAEFWEDYRQAETRRKLVNDDRIKDIVAEIDGKLTKFAENY
jgi:hypothetical protein